MPTKNSEAQKTNFAKAKELIIELIFQENIKIGEAIPSIPKLSETLPVGRISICQAIDLLAEEGILKKVKGKGCFLQYHPDDLHLNKTSFLYLTQGDRIKKKIRLAILGDLPQREKQWENIIKAYEKNTNENISIELIRLDDELKDLQKSPGNFDLIQIPSSSLSYYAQSGLLLSPQELGGFGIDTSELYSGFAESCKLNGETFGVPVTVTVDFNIYNLKFQDIIDKLHPFTFWESMQKLEELSKNISSRNLTGLAVDYLPLFSKYLSVLNKNAFNINDFAKFSDEEELSFLRRFEPYFNNKKIFVSENLQYFLDQKTAFVTGNSYSIPQLNRVDFSWGIFPMFHEKHGSVSGYANLTTVSAFTPYPEECVDFLRWLVKSEAQTFLAECGYLVANKQAMEKFNHCSLNSVSIDSLKNSLNKANVIKNTSRPLGEFVPKILAPEVNLWRLGHYNAETFIETIRRRTKLYSKSCERLEAWQQIEGK